MRKLDADSSGSTERVPCSSPVRSQLDRRNFLSRCSYPLVAAAFAVMGCSGNEDANRGPASGSLSVLPGEVGPPDDEPPIRLLSEGQLPSNEDLLRSLSRAQAKLDASKDLDPATVSVLMPLDNLSFFYGVMPVDLSPGAGAMLDAPRRMYFSIRYPQAYTTRNGVADLPFANVAGVRVAFYAKGAMIGEAITDDSGFAEVRLQNDVHEGPYDVRILSFENARWVPSKQ